MPPVQLRRCIFALLLALLAPYAHAACTVRISYSNQEVVPYYMGSGALPAKPPGASVDLMTEIAASAGCRATFHRLPPARTALSVDSGSNDAAPLGLLADPYPNVVYPLDKDGQPDRERAVQMHTVVFVRAADKLAPGTDPHTYFKQRKLGTFHGASFAALLRQDGFDVDDDARDTHLNMEKLKLGRIDGVLLTLANPSDLDAFVLERYHGDIVRLDKPLRTAYVWLAVNRKFYAAHRAQVDAMWAWTGAHGRVRLGQLLTKYGRN